MLATARLHLLYAWRHRRRLRLASPRLFTEWVQHRKVHDRDPVLPVMIDKVAAKPFVAARLGDAWVIPTLWHGRVPPDTPPWPMPFVLKARHGCGQLAIVRTVSDWRIARRRALGWTARYGYWLDEWAYSAVPRGLMVEPFVGVGPVLPIDYKLFVFGGRAAFVQVHLDRAADHRWIVMDRGWRRVSPPTADPDPARPATLARMIAAAETLAAGRDFLRVDLYEVDGRPLFFELTVYPGSGLLPVVPPALDRRMGRLWARARAGRA